MKVGIINVSGYAGMELARILHGHPDVQITSASGRSTAGKNIKDVLPHLSKLDITITEDVDQDVDLVFSALPHTASAEKLSSFISKGIPVVDISADFRLKDVNQYKQWYGVDHPHPEYIGKSVYGLPELHSKSILSAKIVANPGCYPTSSILALAPAIKAGIIEPDIIIDAKSGVSGAGRDAYAYSEVNESTAAYKIEGHQHLPEISQELTSLNNSVKPKLTFVPHLVPMTRGILATCYAPLNVSNFGSGHVIKNQIRDIYCDFYSDKHFVQIADKYPMTKHTLGSNNCVIYPTLDIRSNRLVVISCIDNLIKGAAGQAVQNMNLMFGLPEVTGLQNLALYP